METSAKIFVAGSGGMVGSAIVRKLKGEGYRNIITISSSDLDLRNQQGVASFFKEMEPEYVFLAAAKVGGILANNNYPAAFLYENLMIQNNVIDQSFQTGVSKLIFLGSSCIYPKMAPQPLREEYLLTGALESTNEAYAIAKIAGVKMCDAYRQQYGCNFISVMPTNLYGPNDNYNLETSHVLPALIRKFHEAKELDKKEVSVWGTGKPKREFMFVDDLADACYFLMKNYNDAGPVNIGTGEDISIEDLAGIVKEIIQYSGTVVFDHSKPDGTPRKLLDVSKLNKMGWKHKTSLYEGLRTTYKNFINSLTHAPEFIA